MTSLFRDDVSVPMLACRSSRSVLAPGVADDDDDEVCCARARAVASPMTPPPMTYHGNELRAPILTLRNKDEMNL